MRPHQCWEEGEDHLPWTADRSFSSTPQDTVSHLCHKLVLLAYGKLGVQWNSQVLYCQAPSQQGSLQHALLVRWNLCTKGWYLNYPQKVLSSLFGLLLLLLPIMSLEKFPWCSCRKAPKICRWEFYLVNRQICLWTHRHLANCRGKSHWRGPSVTNIPWIQRPKMYKLGIKAYRVFSIQLMGNNKTVSLTSGFSLVG